jgi:type IV pilus assembly protein PilN
MLVKINFLPYREQNQKNKQEKFKQALLLTLLATAGAAFLWGYVFDYQIGKQQQRNEFLSQEIQRLDQQLIEVKNLEKEVKELMQQRDTVYKLQNNRAYALEWLEMLVRRSPEELYLTKVEHDAGNYTISGIATNNERVSQFMTQLDQVEWVRNTRLVQSEAKVAEEEAPLTGEKIQRTLYEFTIGFERKTPDDILQSTSNPTLETSTVAPEESSEPQAGAAGNLDLTSKSMGVKP